MDEDFLDYFEEEQESEKEEEQECEKEDEIIVDEDEDNIASSGFVESKEKITTRYLTKYERAKVIGIRATQLSQGSPSTIISTKNMTIYDIAWEEIKQKKCPYIIKRYLPDGSFEEWNVNDLEI